MSWSSEFLSFLSLLYFYTLLSKIKYLIMNIMFAFQMENIYYLLFIGLVTIILIFCLQATENNKKKYFFKKSTESKHPCNLRSSASFSSLSGGQQREIIVPKSDTKVFITDYSPSKDYTVSVIAVSGTEQSRPLQGRHKGAFMHLLFFTLFFCIVMCSFHILNFTLLYSSTLLSI